MHSLYRFHGRERDLNQLLLEIPSLDLGGTLEVHLANHALQSGFQVTLYTYNLELFDPTWFHLSPSDFHTNLRRRQEKTRERPSKFHEAIDAYLQFLELGGCLRMRDLSPALLAISLRAGLPVMAGLSATYLYQEPREIPATNLPDDLSGDPAGHFVIISGYDPQHFRFTIADPLQPNPFSSEPIYHIDALRTMTALLLGTFTYDASLLILEPYA
ncbi:MAG: hypothetical protein Q8O81_01770 [Giesbergeria sp.]|nr:hypothetical protein [Giesbergeria sp.]